jgi:hypothetical protein
MWAGVTLRNMDDLTVENLAALQQATKAFRLAEKKLDEHRAFLHRLIAVAVTAGVSKSEVARRTGYTREYVARICQP